MNRIASGRNGAVPDSDFLNGEVVIDEEASNQIFNNSVPYAESAAANNSIQGSEPVFVSPNSQFQQTSGSFADKWSSDMMIRHREHFVNIKFNLFVNGSNHVAKMVFARQDSSVSLSTLGFTLKLPLDKGSKSSSLSDVFKQEKQPHVLQEMMSYINNLNIKNTFKGYYIPDNVVMIKRLYSERVCDNLAREIPLALSLSGINGKHVQPHVVWDGKTKVKTCQGVVSRTSPGGLLYRSITSNQPILDSIHGCDEIVAKIADVDTPHDDKDDPKPAKNELDCWGKYEHGCRSVSIMSGKMVWLVYEFLTVLKDYENVKKSLPPDFNEQTKRTLEGVQKSWVDKNNMMKKPSSIYEPETDLTDGHMGLVLHIIHNDHKSMPNKKNFAWTIHPEEPLIRLPNEFIEHAHAMFMRHIGKIVMTRPAKITAKAESAYECETVPANSYMSISMKIDVFFPSMFFTITEVK